MAKQLLPSYDSVEGALLCLKALGSASETHGLLTALFSAGTKMRKQAWVNSLLISKIDADDEVSQGAKQTLENLFDATVHQLREQDSSFTLLLPEDNAEIELRIDGLAQWCQGFMSGLKLLGIEAGHKQDSETQEALRDLTKVACMAFQDEQTGRQEDEVNYVELVEYVRTAVQLFNMLSEQAKPLQQGAQQSDALH